MKREKLETWITRCVAKEAGLRPHDIDTEAPLITYMLNGFQSCRVVSDLGAILGRQLPESVLYSRRTINELAEHLSKQFEQRPWVASIQKIYLGPIGRIAESRPLSTVGEK